MFDTRNTKTVHPRTQLQIVKEYKSTPEDWEGWQPNWRPQDRGTHRQQEKHSPTKQASQRRKNRSNTRRRIVDARLWESMTLAQQDAAREIAFAYETMGRDLGYTTSNWQRIPGGQPRESAAEFHARLVETYIDWAKACHRENCSHAMIIDILVFGLSCRQQDSNRRQRNGSAKRNLMTGLSLYCRLKGWPEQ